MVMAKNLSASFHTHQYTNIFLFPTASHYPSLLRRTLVRLVHYSPVCLISHTPISIQVPYPLPAGNTLINLLFHVSLKQ